MDDCPVERFIPIHLVVMGVLSLYLVILVLVYSRYRERVSGKRRFALDVFCVICGLVVIAWFIAGESMHITHISLLYTLSHNFRSFIKNSKSRGHRQIYRGKVQTLIIFKCKKNFTIYHTRRGRRRGGACRRRPNFEGAKGAKFRRKPPFLFVSEQSRMSTLAPCQYKKCKR